MLKLHIDMRVIMGFAKALEQAPGMVAEEQRLAMRQGLDVLEPTIGPRTPGGGRGALCVVYVLARAMGRYGTKAAKMLEEGFHAAEPIIVQIWEGLPER